MRLLPDPLQDAFAVPRPDLQVTILSFGSSISEPQPLASDGTNLARVIDNVQGEHGKDGKTLLYLAIVEAIRSPESSAWCTRRSASCTMSSASETLPSIR